MEQAVIEVAAAPAGAADPACIAALEAGKVLYFPALGFTPLQEEARLFTPAIRDRHSRNISLDAAGHLKGAIGDATTQAALAAMIMRFRAQVALQFLPRLKRYSRWRAKVLKATGVTKSLRSEYDHRMLQLHDAMKSDPHYQRDASQLRFSFPTGTTWVCFSDQTAHAAMSGQYVLEQTMRLPPGRQYDTTASPLAILSRLTGRDLV
jgi:hypothetical protein